jgi:hypothetical protein
MVGENTVEYLLSHEMELPGFWKSRAIERRTRVAKPKIPYWGIAYHFPIALSIAFLGIFKVME